VSSRVGWTPRLRHCRAPQRLQRRVQHSGPWSTQSQISATSLDNIFDGDNPFTHYMAVLGGLGLADQIYVFRRLKLNLTMQMALWKLWFSPAHWASFAGDVMRARLISAFSRGIDSNI
jgi:hypothetical protein